MKTKRFVVSLSNGICVMGAKIREGNSIVTLLLTDFYHSERMIFDTERKIVIGNKRIDLNDAEINSILEAIVK